MKAILKREVLGYFRTPLGYVVVAVMYFFTNYYFFTYNLYNNTTNFTTIYSLLFSVVMFIVPVLTMRLMSEDKRIKTEQTLFTAPVSRIEIVLAKYLTAIFVYLIAISATLIDALIVEYFAEPDWPVIIGNFTGLFLLGAALISICLFLSSLTESQVIAAISGFAVSLFLLLINALSYIVSNPHLQKFFSYVSFYDRYLPFTYGVLDLSSIMFFTSFIALFLCFTTIVLERRRWC